MVVCIRGFPRNQTVTYILATPKLSALTLELRKISMGFAICDLTTPIQTKESIEYVKSQQERYPMARI